MTTELGRLLNSLFLDTERLAAEQEPLKHKRTTVMAAPLSYRYWDAGRDGRGSQVLFCWSSHRNVAGFFLGWRETRYKSGKVRRTQWLSRRKRTRCKEIAGRRARAFRQAQATPCL